MTWTLPSVPVNQWGGEMRPSISGVKFYPSDTAAAAAGAGACACAWACTVVGMRLPRKIAARSKRTSGIENV